MPMSPRPPLSLWRAVLPLLALGVATAATRAGAQSITLDLGGKAAVSVSPKDCTGTLTADWTLAAPGVTPCQDLLIWVTGDATCGTAPSNADLTVGSVTGTTWVSQGMGNISFNITGLPVFAGAACPVPDLEKEMRVCAFTKYTTIPGGQCVEVKAAQSPTIFYDSKAPPKPTIIEVLPQDSALVVNYSLTSGDASASDATTM